MRCGDFNVLLDRKRGFYCFVADGFVFIEFSVEIADRLGFDFCVRELHRRYEKVSSKNPVVGFRRFFAA